VHVDFRPVYGTILAKHLGADPERILGRRLPAAGVPVNPRASRRRE
jgi:hypothetical protein